MSQSPMCIDLVRGEKYYWCTCGLTNNQPFCDGSHKGTGKKSLCFEADETKKAFLCTCKNTKNPPFCDGSHKVNHE